MILPDTIEKIREKAFANGRFISLTIPDSVKEIGAEAFCNCADLRYLYFPSGIRVFPAGLFSGCTRLDTIEIGEGVEEIAKGAMKGCPSLRRVWIPASVTQIGEDLFEEGSSVTICGQAGSYAEAYAAQNDIPFSETIDQEPTPQQKEVIYDGVRYIYQKDSDSYYASGFLGNVGSDLEIPRTVNGKPVTGIGKEAFKACHKLKSIHIPGTVKNIGDQAFAQCVFLEKAILEPGVASLGESVFWGCEDLKNVSLPDSVTAMGKSTFSGCRSFESVRLSAGMTTIPAYTFFGASYHVGYGPLKIPEGVTAIEEGAFSNFLVKEVTLPKTLKKIGKEAFLSASVDKLVIPDSVTSLGEEVFSLMETNSLQLGRGIKIIPKGAFDTFQGSMESYAIPDTVSRIMDRAFYNTRLRRISIPASVNYIIKNAFSENPDLTLFVQKGSVGERYAKFMNIPYDNGNMDAAVVTKDGIRYQYNSNTQTYKIIKGDEGLLGEVIIPERINGKIVDAIDRNAFQNCEKVASITLPETIKQIGAGAFRRCGLKTIHLPETMLEIPPSLASGCINLRSVRLPEKLKVIGDNAFFHTGLTAIEFPPYLEEIGSSAFAQSVDLQVQQIPDTVTRLGEGVFEFCDSIKEMHFPGSIKTLPGSTFSFCDNLEKIWIEDGVEEITEDSVGNLFDRCPKLTEIHIADSVRSIEGKMDAENCIIYGFTGSKAEAFCLESGISFISVGTAVLKLPEPKVKIRNGNNIILGQEGWSNNADFFDYVLTKDKDFPQTGNYLQKKEKLRVQEYEFRLLDRGTYYLFLRAGRTVEETGETEYTDWVEAQADIRFSPAPSKIKKVTVKGSAVTVQIDSSARADGYGIVLARGRSKVGGAKYLQPEGIWYATKNNHSTVYTFKNVKNANYCVLARAWQKTDTGENAYSQWSGYSKIIRVRNNK